MRSNLHPSRRGMALIIVLSFLVLLSILLVTFVSVSRIDRSASRNYAQSLKAEELGRGALDLIVADLQQEILAGSTTTNAAGSTVFLPRSRVSMVPARYGVGSEPNLVRRSSSDSTAYTAAYPVADYQTSDLPPLRASAVATSTASANGRAVTASRWNKPALLENPNSFVAPDWIFVTRSGPRVFSSYEASAADPASANRVIGRFAYTIYDVGGLLDVNVAGFPTSAGNQPPARITGGKAFSAYADLTAIPGLTSDRARALVDWRNSWSLGNFVSTVETSGASSGFLKAAGDSTGGDNAFVGRLDLIDYANRNGFQSALRYLGTFSRELNSPSFGPGSDANLNPNFATLYDSSEPIRRFSLRNLALLESDPATLSQTDLDRIEELFGLTPETGASSSFRVWRYRNATIGTPQAAIATGRSPDLFELMKAAIGNRALGVAVANSGIIAEAGGTVYSPETNVHHQVARMIANLADQHDADNFPTTIRIGSSEVYGIESLPYFSEMFFKAHFPSGFAGGTGALYAFFELWNPHQGPIPAVGPARVRIRSNADARATMNYIQIGSPGGTGNPNGTYARVNSGLPELPPSAPFPSTPITLSNLAAYQGSPRVTRDSTDAASVLPVLTPAVNGWIVLTVNRPIPATWTGSRFTSLAVTRLVPVLEYEDAGGQWRPYTTFAGHFTATGSTGVQEAGRPFMNNFNGGGASANASSNSANLSLPKTDPRTFRFRSGVSYSPTFDQPMLPGAPNGQALDQDRSGIAPTNPGLLYSNRLAQTLADLDGVVRPADGYLGTAANPMPAANTTARPVILNRPFRSIGELGYVFRDMPWKSLDFFSNVSADAALLDLFCLEDARVVAGRVSLNTRNPPVLSAILSGSLRDEVTGSQLITSAEAATITGEISTALTALGGPFQNRADLPAALTAPGTINTAFPVIKARREAAVRSLAPNTQTRTWNLLIDVIAETGRFLPRATALSQFTVEGSRRYWLHVAIDRFTGEVIDSSLEVVHE